MSWKGNKVKCDLCAHEWVAVHHASCDKLECPNCRNMAYFEDIPVKQDLITFQCPKCTTTKQKEGNLMDITQANFMICSTCILAMKITEVNGEKFNS